MKEIGAIFVVSISEIRTVQLAAIKRRYSIIYALPVFLCNIIILAGGIDIYNVMTWRREVKRLLSTEIHTLARFKTFTYLLDLHVGVTCCSDN